MVFENTINYRDSSASVIRKLTMPEVTSIVTFYKKGSMTIFAAVVEENQREVERLFTTEAVSKGYSVFIAHTANWIISYTFYKNRKEEDKTTILSLAWNAYKKELTEWYKMELQDRRNLEGMYF